MEPKLLILSFWHVQNYNPKSNMMITDYDATQGEETTARELNPVSEYHNAKLYLQTVSKESGDNLYDHLRELLNKILAERPENIIDFFEEYSRKVKEERFIPQTDHLRDLYVIPGRLNMATQMMSLLKPLPSGEPSTVDPEDLELADLSRCNMLELLYYLENCGLGLPKMEMFFVTISMKNLAHKEPISTIRFWGKIMGTLKNYLILECELKEEEYIKRNEVYQENENEQGPAENIEVKDEYDRVLQNIAREQLLPGEGRGKYPRKLPGEPKAEFTEPPEPPSEPSGVGINKKVYYVSNGLSQPWIQLPDVAPKQIRVARQICKSFTGNLDHPISTYPEFPGTEKEYLRTQIARITASTHIAPLGYYTFEDSQMGEGDEEEDEVEESPGGENKAAFRINKKYEPPALKDLLDGSMSFWVHQTNYILPQGRTTWWNPSPVPDVQDEEMEDEEQVEEEEEREKQKTARAEPETGPPLLTPLSEDTSVEVMPVWNVRSSSLVIDNFAIAIVRSNLWPGAYCFSTQGKLFQNIYIGNGLKHLEQNFSPRALPPPQQEYSLGPEIMEMTDPSGIDEERWRIEHLPKPKILPAEDEEGEGEEDETEEEDEEEEED